MSFCEDLFSDSSDDTETEESASKDQVEPKDTRSSAEHPRTHKQRTRSMPVDISFCEDLFSDSSDDTETEAGASKYQTKHKDTPSSAKHPVPQIKVSSPSPPQSKEASGDKSTSHLSPSIPASSSSRRNPSTHHQGASLVTSGSTLKVPSSHKGRKSSAPKLLSPETPVSGVKADFSTEKPVPLKPSSHRAKPPNIPDFKIVEKTPSENDDDLSKTAKARLGAVMSEAASYAETIVAQAQTPSQSNTLSEPAQNGPLIDFSEIPSFPEINAFPPDMFEHGYIDTFDAGRVEHETSSSLHQSQVPTYFEYSASKRARTDGEHERTEKEAGNASSSGCSKNDPDSKPKPGPSMDQLKSSHISKVGLADDENTASSASKSTQEHKGANRQSALALCMSKIAAELGELECKVKDLNATSLSQAIFLGKLKNVKLGTGFNPIVDTALEKPTSSSTMLCKTKEDMWKVAKTVDLGQPSEKLCKQSTEASVEPTTEEPSSNQQDHNMQMQPAEKQIQQPAEPRPSEKAPQNRLSMSNIYVTYDTAYEMPPRFYESQGQWTRLEGEQLMTQVDSLFDDLNGTKPDPCPDLEDTKPDPCPLFGKWPLEIREMVYSLLLVAGRIDYPGKLIEKRFTRLIYKEGRRPCGALGIDWTILQTCRRIYNEALPILYGRNNFVFDSPQSIDVFRQQSLVEMSGKPCDRACFFNQRY